MNGDAKKEAISARLEKLASEHGYLTPTLVIKDAKKKTSPLHSEFEWDDSIAAQNWRTEQARRLIRSVKIVVVEEARAIKSVAYIRDPEADNAHQGYVPVLAIRNDHDRAMAALKTEMGRVTAALARVRSIAAMLGIEAELAEMEERAARILEAA